MDFILIKTPSESTIKVFTCRMLPFVWKMMCSLIILLFVYSDFRNMNANIIGKHPFIVSFLSSAVKKKPKEYVLFREYSIVKPFPSIYMTTGKGVCPLLLLYNINVTCFIYVSIR
jgi:hypothetical protein